MVNETRKIMGDASIQVTATTVRVPVCVAFRIGQYRDGAEDNCQ